MPPKPRMYFLLTQFADLEAVREIRRMWRLAAVTADRSHPHPHPLPSWPSQIRRNDPLPKSQVRRRWGLQACTFRRYLASRTGSHRSLVKAFFVSCEVEIAVAWETARECLVGSGDILGYLCGAEIETRWQHQCCSDEVSGGTLFNAQAE
jgi:hypothetical protein